MGTRHLIAVHLDGQYRIAQYGQWDGDPDGQGADVLAFLRDGMDRPLFEQKLRATKFLSADELQALGPDWKHSHPQLSRDVGSDILSIVQRCDNGIELADNIDFAGDSLMCEWAYVVDLDANTFEVFKGFNKAPLDAGERFANAKLDSDGYFPVKRAAIYQLDLLPTPDFLIGLLCRARGRRGRSCVAQHAGRSPQSKRQRPATPRELMNKEAR